MNLTFSWNFFFGGGVELTKRQFQYFTTIFSTTIKAKEIKSIRELNQNALCPCNLSKGRIIYITESS